MKVLVITGDKNFKPGHPRFELQRQAVDELVAVYWGRGSIFPQIPEGPLDVVTAQDPFWRGHYAWHLSRRLKTRLNIQVHTDLSAQPWLRRSWAVFNLRKADSVRVVSERIKKQVESLGIHSKITVLPVFVDIERFRGIVRQPHPQKTILWVGRFEEEKDPMLAINILKKIPNAKLCMLGKGSLESVLREEAKGLEVEFPGWQDPAAYLPTTDVVLCTSKHESYGASIVEALAAGVPVVAPDVGIAKEAGATVVPREKLADAVIEVLKTGPKGELKLPVLSKEEWVKQWKETL